MEACRLEIGDVAKRVLQGRAGSHRSTRDSHSAGSTRFPSFDTCRVVSWAIGPSSIIRVLEPYPGFVAEGYTECSRAEDRRIQSVRNRTPVPDVS